jgi:hypothetical protein
VIDSANGPERKSSIVPTPLAGLDEGYTQHSIVNAPVPNPNAALDAIAKLAEPLKK